VQLVAEIERALAELAKSGPLEVHENGRRLPGLTENLSYEVRPQGAAPLLHLWSEEQSMVRRVVKIAEQSDEHIGFEVQRFGRSRPDLLEIRVAGRERPAGRLRRESFGERLREILSNQFADESVESFTTSSRLEHSLSGCHARGVMRHGSEAWAVLWVSIEESAATLDTSLTAGLLWLAQARRRASGPPISGLRMFVPAGAAAAVRHADFPASISTPAARAPSPRARRICAPKSESRSSMPSRARSGGSISSPRTNAPPAAAAG